MKKINIIGLSGSLRTNSYNTLTLENIEKLLPEGINFEIVDISSLPFFNEDLEDELPNEVRIFKDKLLNADGFIIACPEYNYSITPILKNALDWASRGNIKPLSNKPLAITSASLGLFGGARVQYHLRQICVALNLDVLNKPEVFIAEANKKFDSNGNLIDEQTKEKIADLIEKLINKINKNEQ